VVIATVGLTSIIVKETNPELLFGDQFKVMDPLNVPYIWLDTETPKAPGYSTVPSI